MWLSVVVVVVGGGVGSSSGCDGGCLVEKGIIWKLEMSGWGSSATLMMYTNKYLRVTRAQCPGLSEDISPRNKCPFPHHAKVAEGHL